ncbi:copper chaperone PCu(A)C [Propionibacteriaceae bacterium Y1685]
MKHMRWVVSCLLLVAVAGVAGCQAADDGGDSVAVQDAFVKAMPQGEMTAIFGVIDNPTDEEITVESVSGDVAERVELHEMVTENGTMVMREREGGFVVPAGESLSLEPGGLHIMLIGLTRELKAGDEVQVTLHLAGGDTVDVRATARDMANAQESYDPDGEGSGGHDQHGSSDEPTSALLGARPVR